MPFRFSLQPVLDHRAAREDQCRRAFALARQALEDHRLRLRAVEDEIRRRHEEIRRAQRRGLAFEERTLIEGWIEELERQKARLLQEGDRLEVICQQRQRELQQAARDRKMLERLRDREAAQQRLDEARAERRAFDEIAIRDANRQLRQAKDSPAQERIAR